MAEDAGHQRASTLDDLPEPGATSRLVRVLRLTLLGARDRRDDRRRATVGGAGSWRWIGPDVQVTCRCAHIPEDEIVQISRRPIREEWLDMPLGHSGDGSVADLLAEVVAEWPDCDPT